MTHFLHHLRRNRSYSSQERWGVFGVLLVLTVVVSASGWMLFGKPSASAETLTAAQVKLTASEMTADGKMNGEATITIANKATGLPVAGAWVGLQITDPLLRTPRLTYFGWYSPKDQRAFFQTDEKGNVVFPLTSEVVGTPEYKIYTANPKLANDAKYQSLDKSFTVNFVAQ